MLVMVIGKLYTIFVIERRLFDKVDRITWLRTSGIIA